MVSTTIVVLGSVPVLLFTLWFVSTTLTPPSVPDNLRNKRIILLIAHPDDESMFFSPTLQALTHRDMGNHLKILCLSTGNAEGLGETRRKELETAALTLGVRRREDVFVMDDERFRDGMKEQWDPKEVARVLAQAFAPQLINPAPGAPPTTSKTERTATPPPSSSAKDKEKDRKSKSSSSKSSSAKSSSKSPTATPPPASQPATPTPTQSDGPRATIDILLTFDPSGISAHPNHIALHHASTFFLRQIMKDHTGHTCPVDLYTLTSINLLRKYTFILDLLPTYIAGILGQAWSSITGGKTQLSSARRGKNPQDDRVVFVSDIPAYMRARRAMVKGHQSQMVWFRWAWIALGRYMVINDLKRELIPGV